MTSLNTEYNLLEEILADLILEEQAKLGYPWHYHDADYRTIPQAAL